ncbi:MAG TPA: M48 family metalloprotease [Kofleriaceae bacterium]
MIRALLLALRIWLLIAILAGCAPPTYLGVDVPSPCRGHDVENCLGWMVEQDLVSAELGLYEDDQLRAYVQSVATRLSARSLLHSPPRVLIANRDGTYATLGARIVVGRPTLELLADEDELAAVLGHELAHLEGRHPAIALFEQPSEDEWLANRRDAESIADERAVELLARSGYDPAAVGRALRAVLGSSDDADASDADDENADDDVWSDGVDASANSRTRSYALVGEELGETLDDHPATAERLVRVDALAATHASDVHGVRGGHRDSFRDAVIGMVRGRDPRLGVRVGDAWVIAALEVAVPIAEADVVRSANRTLSLRRGRSRLAGYTIGTPWARELSALLLDGTHIDSPLGIVTLGTVPRSGAANPVDDSPLGKLARATRATLPQPPPGAHIAILERPHGALVIEVAGGLTSIGDTPLGVRVATSDEIAAAQPARVTARSFAATIAARTGLAAR